MKGFINHWLLPCGLTIVFALGVTLGLDVIDNNYLLNTVDNAQPDVDDQIESIEDHIADLESGESDVGDISYSYYSDIMGFSGYCIDSTEFDEFYVRDYYSGKNGDQDSILLGHSYNFQVDNYMIDIDGDGRNELLCNCMAHMNGHKELYVYRWNGKNVEIAYVNWLKYGLDGLNYWGFNAVNTKYDAESGKIEVTYCSSENEDEDATMLVDFAWLDFSSWDGESFPSIDQDEAYARYGK